jgi:hypothetical protein
MSLSGSRHGDPLVVASKTLCRRRLKNALNDSVLKNIFTYTSQAGSVIPVGTCFFLGHDPKEDAPTVSPRVYAVTARHVVDKLRKLGRRDLTLRLNRRDPAADVMPITIPLDEWFVHPSDASIDVAIRETAVPPEVDHVVVPMKMCTTQTTFAENEVELGDEVFISGLFRHHYGKRRNVPIIRVVAIDLHNRLLVTDTRTKAPSLWLTSVAITAQAMARIGQSNALLQKTHSSVTPFARVYSSARASTFNPARAAQVLI